MKLENLQDLLIDQMRDLYSAEKQLTHALPKMAKAATDAQLKQAFTMHLEQTNGHVERLEKVFQALGKSPNGKKCKAMEGLVEEGSEAIEEKAEPEVKDAALIAAAQRVEHYEIAGYGTVRAYAEMLGNKEALRMIEQTLEEEKDTDVKLTKLAMSRINLEAEGGQGNAGSGARPASTAR